jgi:O-methyltransferase involved in polyketide biosynthesis
MTDSSDALDEIDTTVAHSARVWNYWLGGKDNFAADRMAGDRLMEITPDLIVSVRASRAFLGRAVRYLVGEAGIRQLLDIGTGLPTADNTHEVAQAIAPESRVVYVDNDPIVLVHARALLTSSPEGATDYVDADVHDPETILRAAAQTLDFGQPVAVLLLGTLNFVEDTDEAEAIVRRLMAAVPSGSYLAIAHPTTEVNRAEAERILALWNKMGSVRQALRSRAELARFFDGLEMVEPGLVSCTRWRPAPDDPQAGIDVPQYCGVGRKP